MPLLKDNNYLAAAASHRHNFMKKTTQHTHANEPFTSKCSEYVYPKAIKYIPRGTKTVNHNEVLEFLGKIGLMQTLKRRFQ